MSDLLDQIQKAMTTIETTLDVLTTNGHDEIAFALSKAHFGARVRASWPASLAPLLAALKRVEADATLKLSADQRADVSAAIATLARVINV